MCIMQGDGNLVIYTPGGHPIWSSNTAGSRDSHLVVQGDANVVIYPARRPGHLGNEYGAVRQRTAHTSG